MSKTTLRRRRTQPVPTSNKYLRIYYLKSRTRNDGTVYTVTIHNRSGRITCDCPARRWCWHKEKSLALFRSRVVSSPIVAGRMQLVSLSLSPPPQSTPQQPSPPNNPETCPECCEENSPCRCILNSMPLEPYDWSDIGAEWPEGVAA